MMVPIEKLFLRNQKLQKNPRGQKTSPFYKRVRDSMKKEGRMINPLLCIQEGDCYAICMGNNRYLAGLELGHKEMPVKVITSEAPKDLMAATADYIPTEVEGYPPRAREYERRKNEL